MICNPTTPPLSVECHPALGGHRSGDRQTSITA